MTLFAQVGWTRRPTAVPFQSDPFCDASVTHRLRSHPRSRSAGHSGGGSVPAPHGRPRAHTPTHPHAHTHAHKHPRPQRSRPRSPPGEGRSGGRGRAVPRLRCRAGAVTAHRVRSCRCCVGPQMEPPPGAAGRGCWRAGERARGREGKGEGRREDGGAAERPPDILTSPPPSSPPPPLASPRLPVGNPRRFPLAPHTRRRGRWPGLRRTAGGCWQGPPWGAPARPPRGSRRTGTSPPPSAGSRRHLLPSLLPSLPPAAAAVGSSGRMRGEGSCGASRHPRVPTVASGCAANAKVKHQGCVVLGFVLLSSCPNGYKHVPTEMNISSCLYTHVVFAHFTQNSQVRYLRLVVLKGHSFQLMQGVESPVAARGCALWSLLPVAASPKAETRLWVFDGNLSWT